jgi:hypothetical protein
VGGHILMKIRKEGLIMRMSMKVIPMIRNRSVSDVRDSGMCDTKLCDYDINDTIYKGIEESLRDDVNSDTIK